MKKILSFLMIIIILGGIGVGVYFIVFKGSNKIIHIKTLDMYVGAIEHQVKLKDVEFLETEESIARGTKVLVYDKEITKSEEDKTIFKKIKYNNKEYLLEKENLFKDLTATVLEEKLYLRTSSTVYKEPLKVDISGFLKKGTEIEIIGFNKLDEQGIVDYYKIKSGDTEGYIASKYIEDTQEKANQNYDFNGNYATHASRTDRYGGGDAGSLDYFPREKPNFENNKLIEYGKTLYLNGGVLGSIETYIDIAKKGGVNSFVVDIKENTSPSVGLKTMETYSPTTYTKALNTVEKYKNAIKRLKDEGFYVIGRITTFKDSYYIEDHPEHAISYTSNGQPFIHNGSKWPSPFNRTVWEYNVKLAVEAVEEFGFNEIQFDYVRFMDRTYTYEKNGTMDMKNTYGETKAQAIQNFLMYATDQIHQAGAYVSADVFGESANNYVTGYGQYWPAISNVVDVICAMPYPDHFDAGQMGLATPWTQPYTLMKSWASTAALRQAEVEHPAIPRTWIQAYNAIKPPHNIYGPKEVGDQIKGLKDGGLNGGFITWHSGSNIDKYNYISSAFGS